MLKTQAQNLPYYPGVYLFKDIDNQVLYVGKARNLNKRVASYFKKELIAGEKTQRLMKMARQLDHIVTETELEALLLESDLIKRLKPRFNIRLKDDKAFKFIKVTVQEDYPRVLTVRQKIKDGARYFGPFPEGSTVNKLLRDLRRMFPYCTEAEKILHSRTRGCFYSQIGLCPGVCTGKVTKDEYRRQIRRLVQFLSGHKQTVIKSLKTQMKRVAKEKDFETAAILRDKIARIEYITQNFHSAEDFVENPNLRVDLRQKEIGELIGLLSIEFDALNSELSILDSEIRIEAYDISHLSGKNAVGSMVVFVNGESDKSQYRRFRIKGEPRPSIALVKGDTDFMREVLERRFAHLPKTSADRSFSTLPHLILVDGGRPQVNTAVQVLKDFGLGIPIIGLAKRWEEIILPSGKSIRLSKQSPALQLLQRLRDESHRFAHTYQTQLRRKQLTA